VATFEGRQLASQTVPVPEIADTSSNAATTQGVPIPNAEVPTSDFITTGMAIFDPLVQQFLTQDETQFDLPFLPGDDLFDDFDWFGTTTNTLEA